jgi:hypothetical protein
MMRDLARRFIARDGIGKKPGTRRGDFDAVARLRRPVSVLAGGSGFRSLLSRALVLASAEVRWLGEVHIKPDGSLERPGNMAEADREQIVKGEVALTGHLLGLLVTLIGEALTLRLLEDAWPEIRINDFHFQKKGVGKERK